MVHFCLGGRDGMGFANLVLERQKFFERRLLRSNPSMNFEVSTQY